MIKAEPFKCCTAPINAPDMFGKIVIVERGDCMFIDKVRHFAVLHFIVGPHGEISQQFEVIYKPQASIKIKIILYIVRRVWMLTDTPLLNGIVLNLNQ